MHILTDLKNNTNDIRELIKHSHILLETDLKEAKRGAKKALSLAKQNNDQENTCRALNLLADIYRRENKFFESIKLAQESLKVSQATGNKKMEAAASLILGVTLWHKGEFNKANQYLEIALKLYHELNDQNGIAKAYNNLSLAYWEIGELHKALQYQELCLELEKQLKNSKAIGISYLNLGLIYEDLGDWEKANECFFRALAEKERIQDKPGIVLCYNNIGEIYLRRRKFDKAMKFFKEALRFADETNSIQNKAEVLGNIGYLYFLTDNPHSAITFYNQDFDISSKLNDKVELAETYRRFAETIISTESRRCHSFLQKALRLARLANSRKELGNTKRVFGKFYAQIGNHIEAETCFKDSIEILKSISKNYELAETYRDYGKYLIEKGAKQSGINYLKESAEIYKQLDIPYELEKVESLLIQLEGIKEKGLSLLKRITTLSGIPATIDEFLPNCLKLFQEILNFQDGAFFVFGQRPILIGNINPDEIINLSKETNIQCNPSNVLIPLKTETGNAGILFFRWSKENRGALEPIYWEIIANILSLQLDKLKLLSIAESQPFKKPLFKGVVGETEAMKKVLTIIEKVAPTNVSVLIRGESGTGKELVARTIHEMSNRAEKPFITINCSAIPETLLESELFGIEQGTATGVFGRKGKLELANNGTVFLDEIGDMSFSLQAKLLRVIQEKNFERVGGRKSINVNIRFIAATNKDLEKEIAKGNFRDDLYHRLNVISIFLPPLRERKQDIPLFIEYFLEKFAHEFNKPIKGVTKEVLASFLAYSWPGNIREMENTLERAVILSKNNLIGLEDLPPQFKAVSTTPLPITNSTGKLKEIRSKAKEERLIPLERDFIIKTLIEHNYNISKTAQMLGISRIHLYRLLKKYQINVRKNRRLI
ncbi:MAG: sigma 54-interacting transcriptional regulator [candidate division WOR-3 bacterium]